MLSHCLLPVHFTPIFGMCFLPWIGIVRENKLSGLKKCPSLCNLDLMWREAKAGLPCTCLRSPVGCESVFPFTVSSASSLHALSRLSECAWISVFSLFPETKGPDSVTHILNQDLLPPPHSTPTHSIGTHTHVVITDYGFPPDPPDFGNTVFSGVLGGLARLTEIISKSLLRSASGKDNGHSQRSW